MGQLDNLGRDGRGNSTRPAIELDDTLDIRLHLGLGENAARPDRHFVAQLFLFQSRISLKHHLIDDRVLDDGDGEVSTEEVQLHIGKQIGSEERLQGQVDLLRISDITRLKWQVRQDRRLLNPLISGHDYALHNTVLRSRLGLSHVGRDHCTRPQQEGETGGERGV